MNRRTLLKTAAVSLLAAPAIAQDTRANTLRFVPQAGLGALDPIWTSATITGLHGMICDPSASPVGGRAS